MTELEAQIGIVIDSKEVSIIDKIIGPTIE